MNNNFIIWKDIRYILKKIGLSEYNPSECRLFIYSSNCSSKYFLLNNCKNYSWLLHHILVIFFALFISKVIVMLSSRFLIILFSVILFYISSKLYFSTSVQEGDTLNVLCTYFSANNSHRWGFATFTVVCVGNNLIALSCGPLSSVLLRPVAIICSGCEVNRCFHLIRNLACWWFCWGL